MLLYKGGVDIHFSSPNDIGRPGLDNLKKPKKTARTCSLLGLRPQRPGLILWQRQLLHHDLFGPARHDCRMIIVQVPT